MTDFTPSNAEEVLEIVQWTVGEEEPIEIVGHGSKRSIGHAVQAAHTLDLSRLAGITLYEPEELVLSARAGTPLAEIEAELARNRQEFAFEPMDYAPLLGREAGRGTIGGLLSANLAGPRRIKSGAARDHVLGVHAVSGRGEGFKSGGRVVKNVTGYDLSKGLAGAWGTLAVTTDVTFKVLPAAETETTLCISGLDDAEAAAAMAMAMGSSAEVSAAAHLPEGVVGRFLEGGLQNGAQTVLRVEGFGPSVDYRIDLLFHLLKSYGAVSTIDVDQSRLLWREIRDCKPFADGTTAPVWRVSVAPSQGHLLVDAFRRAAGANTFYDWQGGLVWMRMEADPEAEVLRKLIAHFGGGHATLVRAPETVKAGTPVFEPQPPALAALSARLKEQFDPKNLLNPGRMAFT
ncbi:FAD linked oxidase-like protein [Nitratireductor indicus C115]|uniref:FAD linked oxidase-like protein n=1 Tax=Nitratireductor indicus C115 TaxID=1231190 RepID=K2NP48_9HYPH|nr:FAD-binding protein [Nitratireductor indicus]EKF41155.1 FAD linked oxidase-like protein [Nitratireductor indicus C115]SFQ64266.1 glycolate oxidase FAD binding subunit [Nitratireductor indicus]